jgi:hypothetical protein
MAAGTLTATQNAFQPFVVGASNFHFVSPTFSVDLEVYPSQCQVK